MSNDPADLTRCNQYLHCDDGQKRVGTCGGEYSVPSGLGFVESSETCESFDDQGRICQDNGEWKGM